ncbi:hypothetical protein NUW58_g4814 [Xylaria curta]|uniref:Uncharacterized protein n=1 Tax=Xylaria curta TaxID=42375 RepID=A0ACC1P7S0_9PEZI|nr:hypothetical protein NUW58_g4814 [Xylaria curta]
MSHQPPPSPPPPGKLTKKDKGKGKELVSERRWPLKRGGYNIEHQCRRCQWWFDSFDPERTLCHLCLEEEPQGSSEGASTSMPTVQRTEITPGAPSTSSLFDLPAAENMQLSNSQYQLYGQEYGATPNPAISPGMATGVSGEYMPMPSQIWQQGYGMSLGVSNFDMTISDPEGGFMQNQTYGEEYMGLDPNLFSEISLDPLAMYAPDQLWMQGNNNIPFDSSYALGAVPFPEGGGTHDQGHGTSLNNPLHFAGEEVGLNNTGTLQPLLPSTAPAEVSHPAPALAPAHTPASRPRATPSTAPIVYEPEEGARPRGNDSYRAWLHRQSTYREVHNYGGAQKASGSSSKKKPSGKRK